MSILNKTITFLIFILILISWAGYTGEFNHRWTISTDLSDYRELISKGMKTMDRISIKGDRIFLQVDEQDLSLLNRAHLNYTILDLQSLNYTDKYNNLSPFPLTGYLNGIYHNYAETRTFLTNLIETFPDLTELISIGKSLEERDILAIKIGDKSLPSSTKPNIYITGCHHAREWISVEIPLLFASHLLNNYQHDPSVKNLLNKSNIYIIPLVNPDGLEFSIRTYRMWRKNRRYNGDLSWGVDLNRNYEFAWGYDDIGSSPYPSSDVYRGPAPFSEPESACVKNFMLQNPPAGALNFHNYSQYILFPWGYTTAPPADIDKFYQIGAKMSQLIFEVNQRKYLYGPGATTIYETNGDTDDWIYAKFGVPSFTVELPPDDNGYALGNFFTSEDEIKKTFDEMLPAMLYFCRFILEDTPPVQPGSPFPPEQELPPIKFWDYKNQ